MLVVFALGQLYLSQKVLPVSVLAQESLVHSPLGYKLESMAVNSRLRSSPRQLSSLRLRETGSLVFVTVLQWAPVMIKVFGPSRCASQRERSSGELPFQPSGDFKVGCKIGNPRRRIESTRTQMAKSQKLETLTVVGVRKEQALIDTRN
jgi:hypothetical protein